jgi:hypothetical protein
VSIAPQVMFIADAVMVHARSDAANNMRAFPFMVAEPVSTTTGTPTTHRSNTAPISGTHQCAGVSR